MILKASAANGSSSDASRSSSSLPLRFDALGGGQVDRAREVVDDGVEQRLHALVLEGGAVQDRDDLAADGAGADRGAEVLGGDLLLAHVLLEDVLVEVRQHVDELVAVVLGLLLELSGDLLHLPLGAQLLVEPLEGLHGDEVDETPVVALRADRQLDDGHVGVEAILDRVERGEEVGSESVHLVDEAHAGHAVLVGLAPHRLGLGLHAGDTVEHRHRAVEHAQRALHLDGEVDVARGVDDVDVVVAPLAGGGGRRDGDAALLLLRHPVHRRGAFVHLADLVVATGVVEDPLGRRGLARVDVGHDPDVADSLERVGALAAMWEVLSLQGTTGPCGPVVEVSGGPGDYQR